MKRCSYATVLAALFAMLYAATPAGRAAVTSPEVRCCPRPSISSLSPGSIEHGSPSFTPTVSGANLVSGVVVYWNGSPQPTTFVSGSKVNAFISSELVAAPIGRTLTADHGCGGSFFHVGSDG